MKVLAELLEFIKEMQAGSRPRNRWIGDDKMSVYVRYSTRIVAPFKVVDVFTPDVVYRHNTLDVASIEIQEEHQGKRLFSRFMEEAHKMNPWDATYLENTNNPIIEEWCKRHNWVADDMHPLCFYRLKDVNISNVS